MFEVLDFLENPSSIRRHSSHRSATAGPQEKAAIIRLFVGRGTEFELEMEGPVVFLGGVYGPVCLPLATRSPSMTVKTLSLLTVLPSSFSLFGLDPAGQ